MCNQCKNIFLWEIIETNSSNEAVTNFREINENYDLPEKIEIVDIEMIGYSSHWDHIEYIKDDLFYKISHKERPLDKIYVCTSALLKSNNEFVVICVADRKRYACSNLNFIPGRRF